MHTALKEGRKCINCFFFKLQLVTVASIPFIVKNKTNRIHTASVAISSHLTETLFPCHKVGSKLLSWQTLRDNPHQWCSILFGVLVQGQQEDVLQLLFFKHGLFIFSIALQEMSNLVKRKGTREMLTEQIYRMLIWRSHLRFIFATLETGQFIFSPGWVLVYTNRLWIHYISNIGQLIYCYC